MKRTAAEKGALEEDEAERMCVETSSAVREDSYLLPQSRKSHKYYMKTCTGGQKKLPSLEVTKSPMKSLIQKCVILVN